jgi:2-desacetyl-2-hydroxyethyl bacteriochlorophyllide A dehydrogenase
MRALLFEGVHNIAMHEIENPVPGEDEVLIEVAAVGVCGSEMEAYLGLSSKRKPPLVFGHEFAGRLTSQVDDLPANTLVVVNPLESCNTCTSCLHGDEQVCAKRRLISLDRSGALADLVAVPSHSIIPVPAGVSAVAAATAEPAATALHSVRGVKRGDTVLVQGCGAIGLFVVQLLRLVGASRIDVYDPINERLALARSFGGNAVDPGLLPPATYDAIVDTVGLSSTRTTSLRLVRSGGLISLVGLRQSRCEIEFDEIVGRELHLRGSYAYGAKDLTTALIAFANGSLRSDSFVQTFPLSQGVHVFNTLAANPADIVKAVLIP